MKKNLTLFYSFFIALILVIVILTISINAVKQSSPQLPKPTPTPPPIPYTSITPEAIKPPSIKNIPTNIPQKGGGLDISHPDVQNSITEIQKLYPHLPYIKDITFPDERTISIVIPAQELQTAPWSLTTQIYNIDYNTPATDPNFLIMKSEFRKSVSIIFDWIRSHGADPEKIIYTWGHRKFIQDQAERWLYNE